MPTEFTANALNLYRNPGCRFLMVAVVFEVEGTKVMYVQLVTVGSF
jgi:hypothetical protein